MKLFYLQNKRLLPWQKPLGVGLGKVLPHQFLQQFVPVQFADHTAGIVVVGDIGGVFRQQVANDLINRIVTLFL